MKKNLHSPYFNENARPKYLEQIKILIMLKINCYDATLAIKLLNQIFIVRVKSTKTQIA